jgi:hypothetical protein
MKDARLGRFQLMIPDTGESFDIVTTRNFRARQNIDRNGGSPRA